MKQLMKHKESIRRTVYHFFMIITSFAMLYPLFWMVFSSFKPTPEIMLTSGQLFPRAPTIQNYISGWAGFARLTFGTFFKNSLFIAVIRVIGVTLSCSLIAFGFARISFKTKNFWFILMIITMCLPGQVIMIPQYLMFNSMDWVGTYFPLLVPSFFGHAFNAFLLTQFMRNIPRELNETAKIDGCSWFGLYWHIILPLVKPALATVAVLTFMSSWDDFYSALLYLNKPSMYPVSYALKLFSDEASTNYGPMLAMSSLSLVPILILFFIFQKGLVEGISTTGIKA